MEKQITALLLIIFLLCGYLCGYYVSIGTNEIREEIVIIGSIDCKTWFRGVEIDEHGVLSPVFNYYKIVKLTDNDTTYCPALKVVFNEE